MSNSDLPPPLPPRPAHLLPPSRHPQGVPQLPPRFIRLSPPKSSPPSPPASPPTIPPLPTPRPGPDTTLEELEVVFRNMPQAVTPGSHVSTSSESPRIPPVPKPRTSLIPSKPEPAKRPMSPQLPVLTVRPYTQKEEDDIYETIDSPRENAPPELRNIPTSSPETLIEQWDTESASSANSDSCSWLAEEPLYQFTRYYETVPERQSYTNLELEEENYYDSQVGNFYSTQHKTPWCGVHRVVEANIIGKLSKQEIAVQEAKFEILTTEASFLKSLSVLKKHFIASRELTNESILMREDHNQLFGHVKAIQKSCKAFLRDVEKCWKKSVFLPGLFAVVSNHARNNFNHYVTYCAQLNDIKDKLKALKSDNRKFAKALSSLENSDRCSRLSLDSFLATPMRRIVNLNLLLKTCRAAMLLNYDSNKTPEFEAELGQCLQALDHVQQVCKKCDTESQTTTRMKKMFELHSKLKFPVDIMQLSIISPTRWLVMHGDLKLHGRSEKDRTSNVLMPRKAMSKIFKTNTTIRLFLLNDMLIMTKPTNDDCYKVKDYCNRASVQVSTPNVFMSSNPHLILDGKNEYKILLIIHENHESKRVELVLSSPVEQEREMWVRALSRKPEFEESLAQTTQRMVCVYPFEALKDGQVSLMKGDEVNVTRTLDNGWLEGVRTRDVTSGCFPPSRVEEASAVFPLVEIFN